MASDDANSGSGTHGSGSTVSRTHAPSQSQPLAQSRPVGSDPMIDTVIDHRYRVLSKIGEGGMGEVYCCEHVGLKKKMAVKLLRAEIVTNEEAVARFRQEAQSASAIKHRNIIEISDIGELPDGRVYMCMEFLEGAAFNDMLNQPLDPARALGILIQTCDGLSAAHRHQIIHRDMKPENIFVTARDGVEVPKLLDFGIAKVSGNDGQNNLTRTGTIFGTPFYMAPEQALGQAVDHRADIYSVGVIIYEVFTGSVPFKAESFMAILTQHITTEPKPPEQMAAELGRQIPPTVVEIINRCMRKEPNERYATMDELKAVLIEAYRNLAGPGMSAYMAPQQASAVYGVPSQSHLAVSGSTPMPTLTPQQSMHGMTSGYGAEFAPKKSRTGLVVLLFLVFVVGGGAAGFFLWQQSRADTDEQAGPVTDSELVPEPVSDPIPAPAATPDAAVKAPVEVVDPVVVEVPKVTVLVNSKPQGAEIFVNGESRGRTPQNIEIPEGQDTTVVLERRGYKDKTFTLNGKQRRVTERLKKRTRGDKHHGDNKNDGRKPGPIGDKDDKIEEGLISDDDSGQLE